MHFTIPETVERKFDGNDAAPYVTFEVHLNGIHHCSVRQVKLPNSQSTTNILLASADSFGEISIHKFLDPFLYRDLHSYLYRFLILDSKGTGGLATAIPIFGIYVMQ